MSRLIEKLTEYGQSDFYPYHMPGHKRQPLEGFPEQLAALDITEIEGFDNLHQPEGILLEAQRQVAEAYGVEESFFLVNGSTCGILSAVSAAVPFGGHLLISRNCHKSVYHGAYLRQLRLSYIYAEINREFDICEAVTAAQVEEMLDRDSSIQAVLIVSPTYEGRIADVEAIAEVVHKKGIPLIVDEAHGAHLGFAEGFAQNSGRLGADLVINSVHKTLPAMTQTALLHCNGNLIDRDKIKRFLHIYQSSSPSYIMMASIEHAVQTAVESKELFCNFREQWQWMLEQLKELQNMRVLGEACMGKIHDIGKLVISTKGTNVPGKQLADMLRNRYHLEVEMACETYVLAMFTIGDRPEGYARLCRALLEIDKEVCGAGKTDAVEKTKVIEKTKVGIPFFEAWDREREFVELEASQGRFAGEFINLYPPGTPIVVPGECISEAVIQKIKECLQAGLEVQGVYSAEESAEKVVSCITQEGDYE